MKSVNEGTILRSVPCALQCPNSGTCGKYRKLVTLSSVEHVALWSFGVAPDTDLSDDKADAWQQVVRNHTANKRWFEQALGLFRTEGVTGTFAMAVASQTVCWKA